MEEENEDVCASCFHFSDVGGRERTRVLLLASGSWDWLNCLTQFLDVPPSFTLSGCGRDVLGAEGLLCLCFSSLFLQMDHGVLSLLVAAS